MILVELTYHLRTLAGVEGDIRLDIGVPPTHAALIDAIEARYPQWWPAGTVWLRLRG